MKENYFTICDLNNTDTFKASSELVAEAKAKFLEDANSTLNSYSDYCNGEVYGYSVVTYDKKGQVIEENECWGYIGYDNANKEKSEIDKYFEEK